MSILKKLSESHKTFCLLKCLRIVGIGIAIAAESPLETGIDKLFGTQIVQQAKADVYDAFRPPKEFNAQSDNRIFLREDRTTYTLTGRYFGEDWTVMMGSSYDTKLAGPFIGGGYFIEEDWFKVLPFVVISSSTQFDATTLNPAIYLEQHLFSGDLVIDENFGGEMLLPREQGDATKTINYGGTIAYQLKNNCFVGVESNAKTDVINGETQYKGTKGIFALFKSVGKDSERMQLILEGYIGDKESGFKLGVNF